MTYNEALAYISSFEAFGIRPGLERIEALCKALNNPQDRLKFIHVAGTNGKGSTSTLIANSLAGSGHKVGLFTSPYVVDFRERFSINGEMISKTELAALVDDIKPKVDELAPNLIPTEFELITALAFLYFYLNNCDYVVLEVGLGGRFDSTNIIKRPLVSVITSVSKDHMAVLGDTIEKIAFEKAGIIKPNVPVVLYPLQAAEAYEVITEVAKYQKSDLFIPSLEELSIIDQSIFGSNFSYKNVIYSLALMGEHMIYNAITALTALELLKDGGNVVDDNAVSRALEKT
ncbi:MAG TPA: Mur ligase family protein, partial [Oscillospiraceae bacterium]|nr:Mur ligase family protein [Oscillospiraceae bacterium]